MNNEKIRSNSRMSNHEQKEIVPPKSHTVTLELPGDSITPNGILDTDKAVHSMFKPFDQLRQRPETSFYSVKPDLLSGQTPEDLEAKMLLRTYYPLLLKSQIINQKRNGKQNHDIMIGTQSNYFNNASPKIIRKIITSNLNIQENYPTKLQSECQESSKSKPRVISINFFYRTQVRDSKSEIYK